VKPLAKDLIRMFGSLGATVNAPAEYLCRNGGFTELLLAAVAATTTRMSGWNLASRPLMSSWQNLLDYCDAAMAHESNEQLRLLFLDRKNGLIADKHSSMAPPIMSPSPLARWSSARWSWAPARSSWSTTARRVNPSHAGPTSR
jgi:hypothetical protein